MVQLHDGFHIPLVGLGTCGADHERLTETLKTAFKTGYRMIDTAIVYDNHVALGKALKVALPDADLKREEITIITKIQLKKENNEHEVENQVKISLMELQLEYLDVVLIHYPTYAINDEQAERSLDNAKMRIEGYKTLLKLRDMGLIRTVGVSNYEARHLAEIEKAGLQMPTIDQVEYHPLFLRTDLLEYCRSKNIFFQAFTSLANLRPDLADSKTLNEIVERTGKTKSGILLSFATSQGIGVIPKSNTPLRIEKNFEEAYQTLDIPDIENLKLLHLYSEGSVVKCCKGWRVL